MRIFIELILIGCTAMGHAAPDAVAMPTGSVPVAAGAGLPGNEQRPESMSSPGRRHFPSAEELDRSGNNFSASGKYALVTSESSNRKRAELSLKKLQAAGLEPSVRETTRSRDVYRLIAGCYGDMNDALNLRRQISQLRRTPFIIHKDNAYCVVASSLMSGKAAAREQKSLAVNNLNATIVKFHVPLRFWRARVGPFGELRESVMMANSLSQQGIVTLIEAE